MRMSQQVYLPTPERIAIETAKIRARWQIEQDVQQHCKTRRATEPRTVRCHCNVPDAGFQMGDD
jgi:hypothetical protein